MATNKSPMDMINQLSLAEKCVAGGAILMFVTGFLPWWHYSVPAEVRALGAFGSSSSSGWGDPGSIWSTLAILVSLFLGGAVLAQRLGNMTLPSLGTTTWGQAFGGGAAAVVVLMLLKAWRISAFPEGGFGLGYLVALVATGVLAYGCYLLYSADKGTGLPFGRK